MWEAPPPLLDVYNRTIQVIPTTVSGYVSRDLHVSAAEVRRVDGVEKCVQRGGIGREGLSVKTPSGGGGGDDEAREVEEGEDDELESEWGKVEGDGDEL